MNAPGRRDLLLGAAAMAAGGAAPVDVRLDTAAGAILLRLDVQRAPLSCAAFLGCVSGGSYDGGAFTRAVRLGNDHGHPPISVLQGAAAPGTRAPTVAHEPTSRTGILHHDGTISLPRDAVGTATGGEFFVCIGDQPALDYGGARNKDGQGFAAFGRVVLGMEAVRRIWQAPTSPDSPDPYTAGQMLAPPLPIFRAVRV